MFALGYSAGKYLLGWPGLSALFLGGVLSISSTSIVVKNFEESGTKSQAFASLVFGVLVIEDLIAVLLLACLSRFPATS